MESNTDESKNPFEDQKPIVKRPFRVRVLLAVILLIVACVAFYFATQVTITHYESR